MRIPSFSTGVSHAAVLLELDNQSELDERRAEVLNPNAASGWVLLNYVETDQVPRILHFTASGEDSVDELKPHLEDGQVQYSLLRISVQEKGTLKTTSRDVFITWIGPDVSEDRKIEETALAAEAREYLLPFHAAVVVLNRDHFTDESVADKSHPLSGSNIID
ncbi:hypothetical protein V2A60_000200 [Cordyceps javanica]